MKMKVPFIPIDLKIQRMESYVPDDCYIAITPTHIEYSISAVLQDKDYDTDLWTASKYRQKSMIKKEFVTGCIVKLNSDEKHWKLEVCHMGTYENINVFFKKHSTAFDLQTTIMSWINTGNLSMKTISE